jgi:hypothetical protein
MRTLKRGIRRYELTWIVLATVRSFSRWRKLGLGELRNSSSLVNDWRWFLVAGCLTTLWSSRWLQFIVILSGGQWIWVERSGNRRRDKSQVRWFVAITVAASPATNLCYKAAPSDSPRCRIASWHVVRPDNDKRRWCQHSYLWRDTATGPTSDRIHPA